MGGESGLPKLQAGAPNSLEMNRLVEGTCDGELLLSGCEQV